jgi:hypothetical protein
MSVPLDRLYEYVEAIANQGRDHIVIYRFWPHGSKKLENLVCLYDLDWALSQTHPRTICHDQEPLDYDFYEQNQLPISAFEKLLEKCGLYEPSNFHCHTGIYDHMILLHSEKRSKNVDRYASKEYVPVYYWSHAVIARDWFRYAEHKDFKKNVGKQFLIYNRAWTGTREYRLRFSDLLVKHNLVDHCLTFCNPTENGKHYKTHTFQNPGWRPDYVLEHYFSPSLADSCASADFNTEDYRFTEIEVVLETLFDDDRLHLTEKSLRPIACCQPFILAATHGSLQYLRDYGFQTYNSVWNETYDTIEDPYQRMQAIITLMKDIASWSDDQRRANTQLMKQIANHNHKHFFSKKFSDQVADELRTNMCKAIDQIQVNPGFNKWIDRWQHLLQFPQIQNFLDSNQDTKSATRQQYQQILEFIKKYPKPVDNQQKN